jgi:hypothetical protein
MIDDRIREAADDELLENIHLNAERLYRETPEIPVIDDYLKDSTDDEVALDGARMRRQDLAFAIPELLTEISACVRELQARGVLATPVPPISQSLPLPLPLSLPLPVLQDRGGTVETFAPSPSEIALSH